MNARNTIAGALLDPIQEASGHNFSRPTRASATKDALRAEAAADAVIAAVRAMPVEDQADLIGGRVDMTAQGDFKRVQGQWARRMTRNNH